MTCGKGKDRETNGKRQNEVFMSYLPNVSHAVGVAFDQATLKHPLNFLIGSSLITGEGIEEGKKGEEERVGWEGGREGGRKGNGEGEGEGERERERGRGRERERERERGRARERERERERGRGRGRERESGKRREGERGEGERGVEVTHFD